MFGWALTFLISDHSIDRGHLGLRRRCDHLYRNGEDHLHRCDHLVLGFGDHWIRARALLSSALRAPIR
jgi:hypothetical protein